ncbi:hypothetical protein [Candidatus Protochlamydia phocaeensis]|uniref:hypothetical protein n=1 Tax=Candidatus Protochlamydia phocaeensis TaxID=1414722 RepID=UPI0008386CCA|nr:hypothetical protein [Candidatus Protochlamydia phocaeensis]
MNTPSVGVGFTSSPNSPDYIDLSSKDQVQETTNNRIPQGAPWNKGVILAKDSLEVPIEIAFGINNDRTEPGKPSLLPLFRTRFVDDHQVEDLSRSYYLELRDNLPTDLQKILSQDEAKPNIEDRDPDLMALDNSLRFEANILALADHLSVPQSDEGVLIGAQQFLALPTLVKQELLAYGANVGQFLDRYLAEIGPNDPSYDLLLNVSNQMKEAYQLFNLSNPDIAS